MRSVPNPSALRFTDDVSANRTAVLVGGMTGAFVGAALWGIAHKHVGWLGVAFPLAGAVGGTYLWAKSDVRAAR